MQKWPDCIRITNPGAFRINIQEALVGGISDPCNESLIKMFNLINVGEHAGSGLPSICAVWQKQHWKTPQITESFGPDRTTLLLPLVSEKVAINSDESPNNARRRSCNTCPTLPRPPLARLPWPSGRRRRAPGSTWPNLPPRTPS